MTVIADPPLSSRRSSRPPPRGYEPHESKSHELSLGRRLLSEGGIVVALSFLLYVVVAALLDFRYMAFQGDAISRMANGFYVLYSRDPHLAAMGFVWNPGQSIADLVPLLGYHLWPPLATHMFAGSLASVVCMAGAVHQVRAALREWGLRGWTRGALTVVFAVNPMIVYYAANGMSEALYLFTLTATTRYLSRWLRDDQTRSLVYAAVALGSCYLVRNEAAGSAILGGVVVLVVTFTRAPGERRSRVMSAVTDATIFLLPVFLTFVGWAVTSYVITGAFFAQLSSQYGNAAQRAAAAAGGAKSTPTEVTARIHFMLQVVEYLAPLVVFLIIVAVVQAYVRRDALLAVPLAVVGGGLAFDLAGFYTGTVGNYFRYFIAAIPLGIFVLGIVLAPAPADPDRVSWASPVQSLRPRSRWGNAVLLILALLLAVPSLLTTGAGMFNPQVGQEETNVLDPIIHHQSIPGSFTGTAIVANYLDRLKLREGDILVDNSTGCVPGLITTVADPKWFVIPNDRDFQSILSDPRTFSTHYILVAPNNGGGNLSQVNRLYSSLYENGGGFSVLAHQFPKGEGCPTFRLYRVTGHTTHPY